MQAGTGRRSVERTEHKEFKSFARAFACFGGMKLNIPYEHYLSTRIVGSTSVGLVQCCGNSL